MERKETAIRREEIVRATLDVATELGMASITIKQVAKRVGVSPAALYRHFSSKNDIFVAVMQFVRDKLHPILDETKKEDDPLEGLHQLLLMLADVFKENRILPMIFVSAESWGASSEINRQLLENFTALRNRVTELIRRGQEEGLVRPELEPKQMLVSFLGLIVPVSFLSLRMPHMVDFDGQIETNWTLFERAIRAEGGHP